MFSSLSFLVLVFGVLFYHPKVLYLIGVLALPSISGWSKRCRLTSWLLLYSQYGCACKIPFKCVA